jgi:23S rRNA pseudouridine1911/1915/1917 synthase
MIDPSQEVEEPETLIVTAEEADTRLDRILAARYSDVRSRSYFQYLIRDGFVLVNGKQEKKQFRPAEGDTIEVCFVLTPELDLTPENIPLDVIYEDDTLIAVNKPVGMVVHPAPGNWSGTFVNALLYHCRMTPNDFDGSSKARPGIVHRLDKETSGVLIAAKDAVTQERLAAQFASRTLSKEYLAICCGNPGKGTVTAPIGRHPVKRKMMAVREDGGRDAVTEYETLASDGKISVVKVKLITGRTHQIRVHMLHLGTPILGDSTYGSSQRNQHYKASRQLLHAWRLRLKHPHSGEPLSFIADVPEDLGEFIQQLGVHLCDY